MANAQLGQTWKGIASGSDYSQIFGNQSYVQNGSDPQLLGLLQQALQRAPELQSSPLAAHVQSGHVGPDDIKFLQQFLESKGYSVGDTGVDAKYGPRTHHGLESFLNGQPPDHASTPAPAAPGQPGVQGQAPGPSPTPAAVPGQEPTHANPRVPGDTMGPSTPTGQTTGVPDGFQPIKGAVDPQVSQVAQSLLGGEFGTQTPFEVNGKRYMARVEHHYHPPGYKGGPTGWHKGVTVYEQKP